MQLLTRGKKMKNYKAKLLLLVSLTAIGIAAGLSGYGSAKLADSDKQSEQIDSDSGKTYDAVKLYHEAFEKIRDNHIALADQVKRDAFIKEYSTPKGADLKDEKSTDRAIEAMLNSQHYLHDQLMRPADVAEMEQDETPTFAGIGAKLVISGKVEAVKEVQRTRPLLFAKDSPEMKDWMARSQKVLNEYSAITVDHPLIIAEEPEAGTPAAKAGLHKNDALIAVKVQVESEAKPDGKTKPAVMVWETFVGDMAEEALEMIRGKEGSVVELKVQHFDPSSGKLKAQTEEVAITRAALVQKVVNFKAVEDCISYVELSDFVSLFTRQEMKDAIDKSVEHARTCNGKGGLILSLRNNPGGNLLNAYGVEAMLMEQGVVAVKRERDENGLELTTFSLTPDFVTITESTDHDDTVNSETLKRAPYAQIAEIDKALLEPDKLFSKALLPASFKIMVLINQGSASASELVAGALKANHRATIIGQPSFGKNVGQTIFALSNGGKSESGRAIRKLRTTSFEFLPGGVSMNNSGIIPDIAVELVPANPGEDYLLDSQVKAAVGAIHDQWKVDEEQAKLKGEAVLQKEKTDAIWWEQKEKRLKAN